LFSLEPKIPYAVVEFGGGDCCIILKSGQVDFSVRQGESVLAGATTRKVRRSALEDGKGVMLFVTNASERETVSGVIDVGRDRRVERSVLGAIRGNGPM
jgi:hypothetical protein